MNTCRNHSLVYIALATCIASMAKAFTPVEDGLYAVFDTSRGEFTARLHYEKAPTTVANFVGLAENTISSFDETDGSLLNKRFYDGITFHRVVSGFVIQSGSRNGTGTDGPGYTIPDEMDPDLLHSKAGILSMANTDRPNSGSSQFFITLEATPFLDGKHSVFGEIVEGMEVVSTIGGVATFDGKPVNDVVINSVAIVREGTLAEGFSPLDFQKASFGNEGVSQLFPQIQKNEGGARIVSLERTSQDDFFVFESSNLKDWSRPLRVVPDAPDAESVSLALDNPDELGGRSYYRFARMSFLSEQGRPGNTLSFDLTVISGINYGPHRAVFGDDGAAVLSGSGFEDLVGSYRWWDLGETIQIAMEYPAPLFYSVQVYIKKGNLASGTAFVFVNERALGFADFNYASSFTLTP